MSGVQEAVQLPASPVRHEVHPNVQRVRDGSEGIHAERPDVPALQARNGRAMNISALCDIVLAHPPPDPNRPKRGANPLISHDPKACGGPVTAASPRARPCC